MKLMFRRVTCTVQGTEQLKYSLKWNHNARKREKRIVYSRF